MRLPRTTSQWLTVWSWIAHPLRQVRLAKYARASRTHPGLRGMLMFEWSQSTGNRLPDEERERVRAAQQNEG